MKTKNFIRRAGGFTCGRLHYLLLCAAMLFVFSCNKEDTASPPDTRKDFAGTFKMEDFGMRIENPGAVPEVDTTVLVLKNPKVAFSIAERLNKNQMRVDLSELMETLWERMYMASALPVDAEVKPGEGAIAVISGNGFVIAEFSTKATIDSDLFSDVFEFTFSANGSVEEGKLMMDFALYFSNEDITLKFTGSVVGFNPQPEPPAVN